MPTTKILLPSSWHCRHPSLLRKGQWKGQIVVSQINPNIYDKYCASIRTSLLLVAEAIIECWRDAGITLKMSTGCFPASFPAPNKWALFEGNLFPLNVPPKYSLLDVYVCKRRILAVGRRRAPDNHCSLGLWQIVILYNAFERCISRRDAPPHLLPIITAILDENG